MTKLKTMKLRLYGVMAFALVVVVFSSFKLVKAFSSEQAPQNLAESGGTIIVNNNYQSPESQVNEPVLSGVTSPDTSYPSGRAGVYETVVNAAATDASTTLFSIASPYLKATSTGAGAEVVIQTDGNGQKWTAQTTTVYMAQVWIYGAATTSYQLACGSSATAGGVLPFTNTIVSTSPAFATYIPTSSIGVVENNVTAAQGAMIDSGTVSKIMLGSDKPYLVCKVTATNSAAFTNGSNTFQARGVFGFRALPSF